MSKHTPGPWGIASEDKTFVYALGQSGTNSFWAHVQSAGSGRISDSEKRANARLIAAAPDLLDALKALLDEQIAAGNECGLARLRAEQQAIDAIRKATGEQP